MKAAFHISLPCSDLDQTRDFYVNKLGAKAGRQANNWLDINLFGNQITFTKSGKFNFFYQNYSFEGKILPSFHFGVIIDKETYNELYGKFLSAQIEVFNELVFLKDQAGEHNSFFVKDPDDYIVEFKCFTDKKSVFQG